MSEQIPQLNLNLGDGRKLEMTPENSTLYTFLGHTVIGEMTIENSSINHVFVQTGNDERGQASGMYFFNEFDGAYKDMSTHMTEYRYPMILNQHTVPACDLKVWYDRMDMEVARFNASLEGANPEDF